MQETILALAALMIIMLIAVNQQRSAIRLHEQVYVREISQARNDLGTSLLEGIVNQKVFDETVITATDIPTDPNTLSAVLGPDDVATEFSAATFDDIDDFHLFSDTVAHVVSADTFRFQVDYSVTYLTPTNTATSTRTFTKEIAAVIKPIDNFSFGSFQKQLTGRFSKTMVVSDSF